MRILIDTQSIIWYVDKDHLLSRTAHAAITDRTKERLSEDYKFGYGNHPSQIPNRVVGDRL